MPFPAKKRQWYLFDRKSKDPFKLSRTKIELFTQCQRCFYLDCCRGVSRPKGPPFALNSAVDLLLKKEFDTYRVRQVAHPLMKAYGIDAVPFKHERMEEWRDALKRGVATLHTSTNLFIRGGIDDVWVSPSGELIIVDYKATSKEGKITLDDEWKIQYKRQMEIYQWLFRQNGFKVSDVGYFVYVNGKTDKEAFDGKLEFDVAIIPYTGSDEWIDGVLHDIKACLMSDKIPEGSSNCEYCSYMLLVQEEISHGQIFVETTRDTAKKNPSRLKIKKTKDSSKPQSLF